MEAMYTSVVMPREWHVMYTELSTQLHKNRLVPPETYGSVFLGYNVVLVFRPFLWAVRLELLSYPLYT